MVPRPIRRSSHTQITDGHGFVAVDEILMSDQPAPRQPRDGHNQTRSTSSRCSRCSHLRSKPLAQRLESALDEYRQIEATIPDPTLALAIADGTGENERDPDPRQPPQPRRARAAAVSRGSRRHGPGDSRRGQRPARPGPADGRSPFQSARAQGHRQPALEAPFRRGPGEDSRRLRRHGPEAQSSRAPRLAGRRIRRPGLVDQGDAPADRHLEWLPDEQRAPTPTRLDSIRPTSISIG